MAQAGVVEEFQRDILSSKKSVTELLRTAKLISAKLSLAEVSDWIESELNGYGAKKPLPNYRQINGASLQVQNPALGWISAGFLSDVFPIRQSVSSVEDLVGAPQAVFPLTSSQNFSLQSDIPFNVNHWHQRLVFSSSHFKDLLHKVKDRLLDWAIELEKRGIKGEGMAFNETERRAAHTQVFNIMGDNYTAGQAGAMGPQAHAHDMNFQQISAQIGQLDMRTLALELETLRRELKQAAAGPEQDIAVGQIAAAQLAVKNGDTKSIAEHLKNAGKWAFDTATKIGVSVAAEAIKKSMGS